MKKVLTSLIALVSIATMAMTASAALSVSVTPAEGDVTNPGHFPNITVNPGDAMETISEVVMTPEVGDPVVCPWEFDSANWSGMIVDCSKVTASGKWTLTIPAGAFEGDGVVNDEVSFTWNYTNPTEGQETPVQKIALSAFTLNQAGGRVQSGGDVENDSYLQNINIELPDYGYKINGTTLRLTSDKGYDKELDVITTFYDNEFATQLIVKSAIMEIKESATYTLHVPAGFVTGDNEESEAAEFTWNYTYTGNAGGSDIPEELTVNSIKVANVDVATVKSLAAINPGDEMVVEIAPIADAAMLVVEFQNITNDEVVRVFEIYNNPYNPDITANPTEGYYRTVAGGSAVNKFYNDCDYRIVMTAYSTTNVNNPANSVWGPVNIDFKGETVPYQYSPVTMVSVSPESGTEVTDDAQPIVLTYSAPVEIVSAQASTGGQEAVVTDMLPYTTSNADKTVWTIKPGKSFWSSCANDMMFNIAVKDENGLVLKGDRGGDAESYFSFVFGCYMAWPTVKITPASGWVEELYSFTIADSRGAGLSYTSVPYVVNENGEKVATVDMNSQVQYDANGRDITTVDGKDVIAATATFHLDKAITEPGRYTLISPRASYALGTEFNAEQNRYFETEYTVVKMPKAKVDVELVNFAQVSFEVLEGKDVVVALTPSEDWTVASLKLNDKDVTSNVTNNTYTIAAIEGDATLVATYEYAHEVSTIQESGVVNVAGNEVTVRNDSDRISIEGVAAGDSIKVYTINGMVIANTVAEQDIVKISCPTGQVYVVVINETAVKIQH